MLGLVPRIVALCLVLCGLARPLGAQPAAPGATSAAGAGRYDGRAGRIDVVPERIDASIDVDGRLEEPVWAQAAVLTGFSRYSPVDGAPAEHSTEVMVWYSPTAIHFGIRAAAAPGSVRATLADRDHIESDDQILIFLSTFNDGRQALVFGVNPLGAQMDGALSEGIRAAGGGFGGLASGRETPDLSPDYVFQSKGRVTPEGYEVEVRIPFKSLRYQSLDSQDWGLHVLRVVPQEGLEESWAPALREGASFLAQAGHLEGLHDLSRGLVLDLNPVATAKIDGAAEGNDWRYRAGSPELGMNVRWGVTPNLTLNGAINPDFSQVESDAGQFQFDPRQALFYPEKRPFFLDGIEQFATPNNLIYTRRVVAPLGAAKLTGKVSNRTTVAFLSAVDDAALSASGRDHPVFNILRLQQDVGAKSKAALVVTDRRDGFRTNSLVGGDARLVWRDIYSLQLQGAVARTDFGGGAAETAPLWQGVFARTGRRVALRYSARGVDPSFRADAGFISRTGVASVNLTHQLITYGRPGSRLERWTSDVVLDGTWVYDDFMAGRPSQDRKLHFNQNFAFDGGWRVGGSVLFESFGYDPSLYADYRVARPGPDGPVLVPFVGTPRIPNLDFVVTASAPQRHGVEWDVFTIWGRDENFYEWSPANIFFINTGAAWKPTEKLRVNARYQLFSYRRRSDNSIVGLRQIPRLTTEYQVTRSIFVRLIAEYNSDWQDTLRDDSRTNLPIYVRVPGTGTFAPAPERSVRSLRADWLFSYEPTPGTVFFAGYGNTLANQDDPRAAVRLRRASDGFFVKVSYLFRL